MDAFNLSESLLQVVLIGISALIFYIYLTWDFDYWKKQGINYATPLPLVGTFRPLWTQTQYEQDFELHKKLGRVFGGFEGSNPILHVADPDIIKQVFVKDFSSFVDRRYVAAIERDPMLKRTPAMLRGEDWKITRAAFTPAFSSGKIKTMIHMIEDILKVFIPSLDKYVESKKPVDIRKVFSAFTLDVVATCAFGLSTNTIENPNNDFSRHVGAVLHDPGSIVTLFIIFPSLVTIFGWLIDIAVKEPLDFFKNAATRVIDIRLANKSTQRTGDFVDCLLEAKAKAEQSSDKKNEKILDKNTIIAQCVQFTAAGLETTATTLSMIAYSLAKDSHCQEKLIKEIDELLVAKMGIIKYEDVASLPYLEMVINEGLRFYSPNYRIDRTCVADEFKLSNGIVLKKGMMVIASAYTIHHDEKYFPNPEVFDPERFSAENKEKINMNAYMPFGLGPRNCPAMRFAIIETKLGLFYMLSKYRFKTCPQTETPVQFFRNRSTLLSPISVTLLLEARNDQPQQLIL
uniref:Cytochrome P450 n=1 Tax=Strigamia maritima TaxID=126957 RepID=T1IH31_STRMM